MADIDATSRTRGTTRSTYLPPQHGAWAFLALPLALGALAAPPTPVIALLGIVWVAAYPLSYAVLGLVRGVRTERFRRPAVLWSAIVVPTTILLIALRPWLLVVGVVYVPLYAVNLWFARRSDERALSNDLVFIAECSIMVPITWAVGATSSTTTWSDVLPVPTDVWILTIVCALVLVGSTLHVKSLIRERADPRYARASKVFAVACLPVSFMLAVAWGLPIGWWLVVPFLLLAIRALRRSTTPQRPGIIGMVELVGFVATAICAALALL